jgi:anti-sigma factor RsiW
MDNQTVRSVLSAYRAGEACADEARFAAAHQQASADPELAQWWQDEQELDRLIGSKLENVAIPAGLKARFLKADQPSVPHRATWPRKLALLAAAIALLAVFFGSWRGLFQPSTSLADYRDEMVSFVRLDPALDLKTSQLSEVSAFLKQHDAPSELTLRPRLQQLRPLGCRTLRVRGQEVALVCFRSEQGDLMHMFVVNRKAVGKRRSTSPQFAAQGDWMTATWTDNEQAYLLTAKVSRETLEKFLGTS